MHRRMNQKIAVSVVYVSALFMSIMDSTIVNVALPTIGRQFKVAADSVDTVSIGYLVSLAVFIPVSGWLGDRIGSRRVMLGSMILFTVASALCGLAQSLPQLVFFRVLQGAGGGTMVPVGMALMFRTFLPEERVRASSILTIPTALAPALGPLIGGLFVTDLSWRWVFYVNLPIGTTVLIFGLTFLAPHKNDHAGRLDVMGFVLSGLGLGLTMYGVSEGPFKGWDHPVILATMSVGSLLLVALVFQELRSSHPLMDIRLFRDAQFRTSNMVSGFGAMALLGSSFISALFLQNGLGLSALDSGLTTFPQAVGVMIGAQIVSRVLYPALGPRRVMFSGLLIVAVSLSLLSRVNVVADLWWMRLMMFFAGYGLAHVITSSQAAGFASIPASLMARASTLFTSLRQLGGAVGVATLSTVVAAIGPTVLHHGRAVPHLAAYHVAYLTAAGTALLAAIVALGFNDAAAARTMVRRKARRSNTERTESIPVLDA